MTPIVTKELWERYFGEVDENDFFRCARLTARERLEDLEEKTLFLKRIKTIEISGISTEPGVDRWP